jgi:hypothetical protein
VFCLEAFRILNIVTSFNVGDLKSIRVRARNFAFIITFKMDTVGSVARFLGLDGCVVKLTVCFLVVLM